MAIEILNRIYTEVSGAVPEKYQPFMILAVYTILIAIYAIFIWKFYKFLARRDILELNLSQYNRTEHPVLNKFLASVFFLLEYVIIMPLLVFFWFSVLAVFLLVLSQNQSVSQILIVSAAIVAAVRITSYYTSELSKDLAKMFPFTVLAIFLLNPDFFSIDNLISRFSEIPNLLTHVFGFMIFIFGLEILMRALVTVIDFFSSSNEETNTK